MKCHLFEKCSTNDLSSNVLKVSLVVCYKFSTKLEELARIVIQVKRVYDKVGVQIRIVIRVTLLVEYVAINLGFGSDTAVWHIETVILAVKVDHEIDETAEQLKQTL